MRVCIIDGHPDPAPERLIHAFCDAAQDGARQAGHEVSRIDICKLDFGFLTSTEDFSAPPPEPVLSARRALAEAEHLFFAFPIWLGSMPAKTKAFFEQAAREEFFLEAEASDHNWPRKMMSGKSARIVVTMGMPGFAYKLFMDAGSLKALERGLLGLSGFKPVRHTICGGVGAADEAKRAEWIEEMRGLGASCH